jgi:hypothetical protein
MVSSNEDCGSGVKHGFDVSLQLLPGGAIHTGKRLIEQQKLRLAHPGAREEDFAHLAVGELDQGAPRELRNPEELQGPPCGRTVGRGRRIVHSNARMPSGLHDFRDRHFLGMARLQVWRDEPDPGLEDLQRHARLDSRSLNSATDGYTVVTV